MSRRGVRLAAGSLRGRVLPVVAGVRPTEGKVRAALMSMWAQRLRGARVLDLFAGSGAVGLELLALGARSAVLVEADRRVEARLRATLTGLSQAIGGEVWSLRLQLPAGLEDRRLRAHAPFDLIFADPPYRFTAAEKLLHGAADLVSPGGALAYEHRPRNPAPEVPGFDRQPMRKYGECALTLYERSGATPAPAEPQ